MLQAGVMGSGVELFVLQMGKPETIVDLARDMTHFPGLREEEIGSVFTCLRPSGRLFEELLAVDEYPLPTPHLKLRVVRARSADAAWLSADTIRTELEVKQHLQMRVPGYALSGH